MKCPAAGFAGEVFAKPETDNGYSFSPGEKVFCEAARLSIELDGFGHGHPDQQRHDAERKAFLTSRGIKELRFWNSSLRRNAQTIRDTIFRELQERAPHPLPDYTRTMDSRKKKLD